MEEPFATTQNADETRAVSPKPLLNYVDAAALVVWNYGHVKDAVDAIIAAGVTAGGAPPAWLRGGYADMVDSLIQFIMTRVAREAGAGGVFGNSLLAPNSIPQYASIKTSMFAIGLDPMMQCIPVASLPLAKKYTVADRQAATTALMVPPGSRIHCNSGQGGGVKPVYQAPPYTAIVLRKRMGATGDDVVAHSGSDADGPPTVQRSMLVQMQGLVKRSDMNNRFGIVFTDEDAESTRFGVRVVTTMEEPRIELKVKKENLIPVEVCILFNVDFDFSTLVALACSSEEETGGAAAKAAKADLEQQMERFGETLESVNPMLQNDVDADYKPLLVLTYSFKGLRRSLRDATSSSRVLDQQVSQLESHIRTLAVAAGNHRSTVQRAEDDCGPLEQWKSVWPKLPRSGTVWIALQDIDSLSCSTRFAAWQKAIMPINSDPRVLRIHCDVEAAWHCQNGPVSDDYLPPRNAEEVDQLLENDVVRVRGNDGSHVSHYLLRREVVDCFWERVNDMPDKLRAAVLASQHGLTALHTFVESKCREEGTTSLFRPEQPTDVMEPKDWYIFPKCRDMGSGLVATEHATRFVSLRSSDAATLATCRTAIEEHFDLAAGAAEADFFFCRIRDAIESVLWRQGRVFDAPNGNAGGIDAVDVASKVAAAKEMVEAEIPEHLIRDVVSCFLAER